MKIPKILWLTMDDVKSVGLSDEDFINCISESFVQQGLGYTNLLSDYELDFPYNLKFYNSSGCLKKSEILGLKWSLDKQDSSGKEVAQNPGMIILNNKNGVPYLIMDSLYINSKCIAATNAIYAKYLAKNDAEVVAIIGNGEQSKYNFRMLQVVKPNIKTLKIFDYDSEVQKNFYKVMSEEVIVDIVFCKNMKEVLADVDIVMFTSDVYEKPLDSWFPKEGILITTRTINNLNWHTVLRMDKVIADADEQNSISSKHKRTSDKLLTKIHAQQCEISIGKKAGRENCKENIIAVTMGMIFHEIFIAEIVHQIAKERDIGREISQLTW